MQLSGARALITGGAGLIGSHIADQLVVAGVGEVVIFDNFDRGRPANLVNALSTGRVSVIEGDIRDGRAVQRAIAGVDLVFHQAALRITQCAETPRLAVDVLVNGTYNVLEAAVKAQVQKVIAASSASIYGLASAFPTAEAHHPYGNRTLYGAAKVFNEGLLRSFNEMYGLPYVALRYFNVYGPRMDSHGAYTEVLIRWLERIAAGEPPLIYGDGSQTMDFIHVTDVARSNLLAAESEASDAVFNIASGVETSLLDLAHALLRAAGSIMDPVHGPERLVNGVCRRQASTEAAKRVLGFVPRISLDEGLGDLARWWSTQARAETVTT